MHSTLEIVGVSDIGENGYIQSYPMLQVSRYESGGDQVLQETIAQNVAIVREAIEKAAFRSGRDPDSVRLMAVTKNRSAAEVDAVIRAGVTLVGENRVQEANEKRPNVSLDAEWHLVGHLQRNKAKAALGIFDSVHSVDSIRLVQELSRRAEQMDRCARVMVQVNTSGEETKFGVAPDRAEELLAGVVSQSSLALTGLMTIGALAADPEDARPAFDQLKEMRDRLAPLVNEPHSLGELSMGMSGDFEVAIEAGATIVRVGTALFGPRAV